MVARVSGEGDLAASVLNSGVAGDGVVAAAALGGLFLWGGAADDVAAALLCSLRRSTVTDFCSPPIWMVKNLGTLSKTQYGLV